MKFLVDTGSSCSVLPVDPNSRDHPQDYLSAVNGSSVLTFGCKNIIIDLRGPVPLNWEFCIAETLKPIIGIDFLSHFDIKIDPRKERLIFPEHIPHEHSENIKSFSCFHRRFGLMHKSVVILVLFYLIPNLSLVCVMSNLQFAT